MKLWKPNDFKVRTIEDKELDILRSEGPVLSAFRGTSQDSPFMKIKPKGGPWPERQSEEEIVLRRDQRSNLRAFYYMLLASCFRPGERSRPLLLNFKRFLYA